jgi:hypothetical protein
MTANNKSSGTNVTMQAITETKTDVTVATHKYVAFQVERIAEVQSNADQLKMYTDGIGYPLQRAKETSLSAIFDGLSQTKGTAGQPWVWDDLTGSWQLLREAGVGEGNVTNTCTWMVSPAALAALFQLDVIISKDYGPGNAVQSAKVQTILDIPVRSSNLLESDSTGQHDSAVYHRDQFILIEQGGMHVESDYIIEAVATAVVADEIYGVAETGFAPETAGGGSAVDTRGVYLAGL